MAGLLGLMALVLAGLGVPAAVRAAQKSSRTIAVHASRQSPDDLEITGLRAGQVLYLRANDLVALPQVGATIQGDPDFPGQTLHVTGVHLDVLAKALGAPATLDLIDALCTDHYRSYLPANYIAQHHPILVLRVDGETLAAWAARAKQDDPAPYFIAYDHFAPAFRMLAHHDQPQVPTNVIRLNFSTEAGTFAAIARAGTYAEESPVAQGFAIAKQNCLRCHFRGTVGGTKSGIDWGSLSRHAYEHPAAFAEYIRNPQAVDSHAQMPANPEYDEATTAALTAYFSTFSAANGRPPQ